jgi:hypothetical protein
VSARKYIMDHTQKLATIWRKLALFAQQYIGRQSVEYNHLLMPSHLHSQRMAPSRNKSGSVFESERRSRSSVGARSCLCPAAMLPPYTLDSLAYSPSNTSLRASDVSSSMLNRMADATGLS